MVEEGILWKFNIRKLNQSLRSYEIPHLFIDSYVIDTGQASLYKENSKLNIGMKNFDFTEEANFST